MSEYGADQVRNSITNPESTVYDDSQTPYTLLEWVQKTSNNPGSADQYVEQYNKYVKLWRESTNNTTTQNTASIKQTYIRFLKEISIKYTTQEEKRYLTNIDFNDLNEADAAIPFFATRIREIIETIYRGRQQSKFQKLKHSMRGGSKGLEKTIFDTLIRYVSGELMINHVLPEKTQVTRHTRMRFVETYDITQDYFDTEYMYTAGGEFVDENGDDYVGYYVEQLLPDGRRMLVAGKGSLDSTDPPRYIASNSDGYVYTCYDIEIVSVTTDPEHHNIKTINVKTSGCDHWTYSINGSASIQVHDTNSLTLTLEDGTYILVVSCVDNVGITRATDSVQLEVTRNRLLQEDGSSMELEHQDDDYLLWS